MGKDITEDLAALELGLGRRLGFPVKVERVANQLTVYQAQEVWCPIACTTEQELLAADNALELLAAQVVDEVPLPAMVQVSKQALYPTPMRLDPSGTVSYSGLYFPTEEGPAQLSTFSSSRQGSILRAKNELATFLANDPHRTIFTIGELRTYQDPLSKMAQAWFDGVILMGSWYWDQDAKIARRTRA